MTAPRKKGIPWSLLLRFVVTVILVGYVLTRVQDAHLDQLLLQANPAWLIAAVLVYGITVAAAIARWQILLNACGADIPVKRTTQLTLIGLFANSFMPGAMGGDIIKAIYAARERPKIKPTLIVSIVMERLLGFGAMLVVSALLILNRLEVLMSYPTTRAAVYLYFTLMLMILAVMIIGSWKHIGRFIPFWQRLPFQKTLRELGRAYHFFLRHPGCLWGGLLLSAVAHLALMLTFYFVALSLNIGLGFLDFAAVLPLVAVVTLLPITINGIGLRELAFESFFGVYGNPETRFAAVVVSLGGFFVTLLWSLLGGFAFFRYKREHPDDAEPDLDELKDEAESPDKPES